MLASARNYTIDLGRLIASLSVVTLHVDLGLTDENAVAAIRLLCRWAVPFFFLVSGYFYQVRFEKDPWGALVKNCSRLLKVFLLTSLVFWPLSYQQTGVFFKLSYLYEGTYIHLWFLPSMIGGFVFIYFLSRLHLSDTVQLVIAFLLLVFVLCKDSYANLLPGLSALPHHHKRFLLSIPFLFLGMYMKKKELYFLQYISWKTGTLLVVVGYALQLAEAYVLLSIKSYPITEHQFLIGTFLMAIGTFMIVLNVHTEKSRFSIWGETYSLLIYLYHPLIIALLVSTAAIVSVNVSLPLVQIPIVFSLTLLLVHLVYTYLPNVFDVLSGNFKLPLETRLLLSRKRIQ